MHNYSYDNNIKNKYNHMQERDISPVDVTT
jgi:hypothetical protein